jgi:hypothetical protein
VLSLLVNANIDDFLSSQAFVVNLRLLLANLTVVDVSRVIIAAVQQADGQVSFTASDVVNSLSDVSGLRRAVDVSRGNLDAPGPAARVLAPRLLDVSALAYTNTSCGVGKLCVAVEVRAFMAGMSDAIEADLTRIRLILESTMRLPAAFAPLASFAPTAWNLTDPATFVTIVPSSIVVVGTTRSGSSPGASSGVIAVLGDTAVVGIVVAGALIILALVIIIIILRRRRRERAKIAPAKSKATAEARTPRPSLENSPRAPERTPDGSDDLPAMFRPGGRAPTGFVVPKPSSQLKAKRWGFGGESMRRRPQTSPTRAGSYSVLPSKSSRPLGSSASGDRRDSIVLASDIASDIAIPRLNHDSVLQQAQVVVASSASSDAKADARPGTGSSVDAVDPVGGGTDGEQSVAQSARSRVAALWNRAVVAPAATHGLSGDSVLHVQASPSATQQRTSRVMPVMQELSPTGKLPRRHDGSRRHVSSRISGEPPESTPSALSQAGAQVVQQPPVLATQLWVPSDNSHAAASPKARVAADTSHSRAESRVHSRNNSVLSTRHIAPRVSSKLSEVAPLVLPLQRALDADSHLHAGDPSARLGGTHSAASAVKQPGPPVYAVPAADIAPLVLPLQRALDPDSHLRPSMAGASARLTNMQAAAVDSSTLSHAWAAPAADVAPLVLPVHRALDPDSRLRASGPSSRHQDGVRASALSRTPALRTTAATIAARWLAHSGSERSVATDLRRPPGVAREAARGGGRDRAGGGSAHAGDPEPPADPTVVLPGQANMESARASHASAGVWAVRRVGPLPELPSSRPHSEAIPLQNRDPLASGRLATWRLPSRRLSSSAQGSLPQ